MILPYCSHFSTLEWNVFSAPDGVLQVYIYFMYVRDIGGAHAMAHIWRSEDNSVELILPFHLYMGSRNQTHISRFVQ